MLMISKEDLVNGLEIIPVMSLKNPNSLEQFIDVYDLGYGIELNANDCLKLIEWWNKEGKNEYLEL